MLGDFTDLLCRRMEEARRSFTEELPLTFLPNPTPTRRRLERARVLAPKFIRYRKVK